MRRALLVQNAPLEGLGLLAPALADAGAQVDVVRAYRGERVPATAAAYDGVIAMGGAPSVYDLSTGPWMASEMELLRAAHGRVPILGVCLGAQLVAHALGGRAMPGDAGPEAGWGEVVWSAEAARDPVVAGLPARVLHLHHDTYARPPGAVHLASSSRYFEQAFRLGRATYGLQFHLDFAPRELAAILESERKDLETAGVSLEAAADEAVRREDELARAARRLATAWARLA